MKHALALFGIIAFLAAAGCTEAGNYIGAVVALVLSGVLMHPEIQEVREQFNYIIHERNWKCKSLKTEWS